MPAWGGVPAPRGGACSWGVPAPRGCLVGGCLVWGVSGWGVPGPGGGAWSGGEGVPVPGGSPLGNPREQALPSPLTRMATVAGGTHPTGMHSCLRCFY